MDVSENASGSWQARAKRVAAGIRMRVLEHSLRSGGGYLSQACSSAEIFATLYVRVMNLGPSQGPGVPPPFPGAPGSGNRAYVTGAAYNGPHEPGLDRFFLSPSQYALAHYAALIETGRMAAEALDQFNRDGSSLEMIGAEHSPGGEVTSGSLGQTISQAAGIAWARRRKGETGRSWLFLSDGEFQIGETWEAVQVMSHYGLDTMGIFVDMNGQQCDGRVETVMNIEPLGQRLDSFGAAVLEVDGHDVGELAAAGTAAHEGKPLVVLARTNPCAGMPPLTAHAPKLHYVRFRSRSEMGAYETVLKQMRREEGGG